MQQRDANRRTTPATSHHHGLGDSATPVPHTHDPDGGRGSHIAMGQVGHAGQGGHDKHAGHDPEMFRRKFWLGLILTVPVVLTSEMVMDWLGYTLEFPGVFWIGPVL